jgi:hypothetical protein
MLRKTLFALAATAALGAAALVPTAASAHGYHGHGHFGFRGFGIAVVSPAYAYSSCWRYQWVETRRGLRRILVNVCGY